MYELFIIFCVDSILGALLTLMMCGIDSMFNFITMILTAICTYVAIYAMIQYQHTQRFLTKNLLRKIPYLSDNFAHYIVNFHLLPNHQQKQNLVEDYIERFNQAVLECDKLCANSMMFKLIPKLENLKNCIVKLQITIREYTLPGSDCCQTQYSGNSDYLDESYHKLLCAIDLLTL